MKNGKKANKDRQNLKHQLRTSISEIALLTAGKQ